LHRRSGGVFDIAVAPVLQKLGMLPRHAGNRSLPLEAPRTADAIELLPGREVFFRARGIAIDLGGIAKGFAADRAAAAMQRHGLRRGLVNAGGDLVAFGPEGATISLRDPRAPGRIMCQADINNEALASSGRRFDPFRSAGAERWAIIDPGTRQPVRTVAGVTVCAPSGMIADALTKVVAIAGCSAAPLLAHYGARALLVRADGDVRITPGWQSSLAA
jgi:thiamine biosynthesis lipoprotein